MKSEAEKKPHSRQGIPHSEDGTPLFRQGDPRWGRRQLGPTSDTTIAAAGCAMTAMAMALSKVAGSTYTPLQLDTYLDVSEGYKGGAIVWDVAARIAGFRAGKVPWSRERVAAELADGRPVVVGVDYKPGSQGGKDGTDHWIVITATTDAELFSANDPATGEAILLKPREDGTLFGGPQGYVTTGQMVVLSRQEVTEQPGHARAPKPAPKGSAT